MYRVESQKGGEKREEADKQTIEGAARLMLQYINSGEYDRIHVYNIGHDQKENYFAALWERKDD